MDDRTIRLRVDGWSNPRFARVEGNFIMFEVMWNGCACPTCIGRLESVKSRLSKKTEVRWAVRDLVIPERGAGSSAVLVVESAEVPEKVDTFLSGLLGLQISKIAPV